MRKLILMVTLAFAAGTAQAQIKCWNDANGKRVCGDAPPPGAKTTTIKGTASSAPAPAPASKDGKDAKKGGPLTPAEQEQEYRKRQQESQKASAKAEAEQKDKALKNENCEQAQQSLRTLESGQRIARTNPSGERYYLDDNQVAKEVARAREAVASSCK
jgi:hypothetical protein